MLRRRFLLSRLAALSSAIVAGAGSAFVSGSSGSGLKPDRLSAAAQLLEECVRLRTVGSAVLHVVRRDESFTRHFGSARSVNSMFLLGSISKPVCVTALMSLFDQGHFQLDDRLQKFIPEFTGGGRDHVTIRHLLSHVSGLADQLPENNRLRASHASLSEFVRHAARMPLQFPPGTQYAYSSMGILLATHVAELISSTSILELVDRTVFQPLGLKHSAQGLGRFPMADMIPAQTEHAAPESGAGDPTAVNWDWNSSYWRKLGAPWGGTHMAATDVARFLDEFLYARGAVLKPETAQLMIRNHNRAGMTPRGLGFNVGASAGSRGCSEQTFGHTGSTGTLAWADPVNETICVVLTSLPSRAADPHPRDLAGREVVAAVN